jgi:predicted AlkP superfamily phosphohydrolase/phosphomutase
MGGGFCINEWLVRSGYLRLQHPVPAGTPLEKAPVDWSKTRAWAAGGYYARVFFNVRGREAEGIVDPADVGALNGELRAALRTIRTPDGREMVTHILEPATMYRTVTGDPPDLMLYFDDLRWRSAGSLGYPTLYLKENDTGPDDAVHSRDGILVVRDPAHPGPQRLCPQDILDVTPTLLALLGETIPGHIQGRAMDLTPAPPRVDQSYPHERIRESPSGSRTTA